MNSSLPGAQPIIPGTPIITQSQQPPIWVRISAGIIVVLVFVLFLVLLSRAFTWSQTETKNILSPDGDVDFRYGDEESGIDYSGKIDVNVTETRVTSIVDAQPKTNMPELTPTLVDDTTDTDGGNSGNGDVSDLESEERGDPPMEEPEPTSESPPADSEDTIQEEDEIGVPLDTDRGPYTICMKNHDLCLHAYGGVKKGNPIQLHGGRTYNAGIENGSFFVEKVENDKNGEEVYTICTSSSNDERCMNALRGYNENADIVIWSGREYSTSDDKSGKFKLRKVEGETNVYTVCTPNDSLDRCFRVNGDIEENTSIKLYGTNEYNSTMEEGRFHIRKVD